MNDFLFVAEVEGSKNLLHVIRGFILVQVLLGDDVIKQLSSI